MKYFLLISIFFISHVFTDTISLDLKKSIELALKESEDFKIQKNEFTKSELKTKETLSILYPQITGESTYLNNMKYPDIPTTKFLKKITLDAGINVNQIITSFGKISNSISAMKKMSLMNKYKKQSVKDEVIFNTKLLYYNAQYAKTVLNIMKQSYENTLKNKELLDNSSETGKLSKRDLIKALSDISSRVPMISNAESTYITSMESLKRNLGLDLDVNVELTEKFDLSFKNFDLMQTRFSLENNQPILKSLEKMIDAQNDIIKSKRAEYFPTLSAFFKHNYKGSSDRYFIGDNILNHYNVVGINLQIPLFYGFRTKSKIEQSKMDKDNAVLTYQKIKKNLELELDKSITEYNELLRTIPANQEAVELSLESFKLSQDLFASGQLSITDLNDAEMMLTNQLLKKEASLFKLHVTIAKIERLACMGSFYD